MKTLICKIIFIFLLQCFANNIFAHVELDYPLGGETFTVGQTVTIEWHIAIAHNTLNWDLLYSLDGGASWEAIQMDLPAGSLSYNWIVPSNITSQARVSVIQDNSAQDYQDESLNFNIIPPAMPPAIITGATNLTIESDPANQDDLIQDWLDNHGGASANAFCGDLAWSNDFITISNGCGSTGSALVTFTATDPCGSTETVATVTVNDTSPPVLNTPASPMVVECDGNGHQQQFNAWLQLNGGATASDAGSNVTWTNNFPSFPDTCNGTIYMSTVLFTATDDCGNIVSTSAVVTFNDVLSGTSGSLQLVPGLIISPNPVSDILKVEIANEDFSIERITLFDAVGHPVKVFQQITKEMFIPIQELSPGLYYVQVKTSDGVDVGKVVIE